LIQERERLKTDFPNADFKDEEYLKELLANNEEHNVSDDDGIPDALCRQRNRRKFYSVNKENESSQDGEMTSAETEVES